MPETSITRPCPVCGFPTPGLGSSCRVCGQIPETAAVAGAVVPSDASAVEEQDDTPPPLQDTLQYLRAGNFSYYVPRCLSKMGTLSMPFDEPDGRYWSFILERPPSGRVAFLVGLDAPRATLLLEMALVEIDPGPQAPVLRAALELNGQLARGIRLSLRHRRLVLLSSGPVAALRPMRFVNLITSFADHGRDLEQFLVARFRLETCFLAVASSQRPTARRPPVALSLEGSEAVP